MDDDTCPGGHINPRKRCGCNSRSEQPCFYCDWWTYHQHCEPKEGEEDE